MMLVGKRATEHSDDKKNIKILYKNWKGKISIRSITPKEIRFESTKWHPNTQWVLYAYDLKKKDNRTFACCDILSWYTE